MEMKYLPSIPIIILSSGIGVDESIYIDINLNPIDFHSKETRAKGIIKNDVLGSKI